MATSPALVLPMPRTTSRKGLKWELLSYALDTLPEVVAKYTNVWLPDDDLRVGPGQIDRLFALFEEYQLQLAQPAIAAGEVSYKLFRQRPGIILRYSPLVELMCPMFTRSALRRVSPTFVESHSGWGLDVIWPRFFAANEVAIIDAVGVEHTRPPGKGLMYQTLANQRIDPRREFAEVVTRHGGFDGSLHQRLVRGTIKLPAIRDPAARVNPLTRAWNGSACVASRHERSEHLQGGSGWCRGHERPHSWQDNASFDEGVSMPLIRHFDKLDEHRPNRPDVALIVSTYQKPRHLRLSLASIAQQKGVSGKLEVVITDDGSTDETFDVVDRFAATVEFPVTLTTHRHDNFQLRDAATREWRLARLLS